MAWSPCGTMLAVGSHDQRTYIYKSDGTCCGKLVGHSSSILSIDWTCDGSYMRTTCAAHEVLYWDIPACTQDKNGKSNGTTKEWASKTAHFGWDVDGIFPRGTDGTHINSVVGSPDGCLVATGDDYGLVRIFNDPCRPGSKPRSFRGHSEHVVRVIFLDDNCMFSIGGQDKTVIQWEKC